MLLESGESVLEKPLSFFKKEWSTTLTWISEKTWDSSSVKKFKRQWKKRVLVTDASDPVEKWQRVSKSQIKDDNNLAHFATDDGCIRFILTYISHFYCCCCFWILVFQKGLNLSCLCNAYYIHNTPHQFVIF